MGNLFCCCLGVGGRRRRRERNVPQAATETTPLLQPHPKEIPVNQSVPETSSHESHDPHHQYPSPPGTMLPSPYFQDAVTVRNDANLRKETLTLEPDPVNPGRHLVAFTFDAVVSGRITLVFFAKEVEEFQLIATKEDTLPPSTFDFELGLGQKFIQPSGTGVDLSVFEDSELFNEMDTDVIPLAIKLEAAPEGGNSGTMQITQVSYVKEEGEIKPRAVKQLLFVEWTRYELQDIYGIGDTLDEDASESGKECVVCLSEPRDMTVLPCRHMCMCGGCAEEVRFQTNLCPVCRQPVEGLLKIIQLSD